ncbi:MAG: hypothetical protein IJZ85_03715 [Lachnospiraceae bacterium]|nr:hypothetical protein [Lachnospiraceae bacterium]
MMRKSKDSVGVMLKESRLGAVKNGCRRRSDSVYVRNGIDGAVRRLLTLALMMLLSVSILTGCQLAKADAGDDTAAEAQRDTLVGIMVTTEWLDLYNMDAWMEDNLDQIVAGGNVTLDAEDAQKYQQRLYATLVERPLYDENGQVTSSSKEFVFEGVEGVMFYAATVNDGDRGTYTTSSSDRGISMTKNHITVNDEGTFVDLEGTIYVVPQTEIPTYTKYPIYQEPDGDMYLVQGSSISFDTGSEGMSMSTTYDEEVSVTDENGEKSVMGSSIKVTIEVINRPERVVVSQLDDQSQLISRVEYPADQMPKQIVPEAETAYIIVEMFKQGMEQETIDRQLYDKEENGFYTMAAREDGICEQIYTAIKWEK